MGEARVLDGPDVWRWGWLELLIPGVVALTTGAMFVFSPRWAGDTAYYQAISLKAAREGHWWTLQEANIPYFNKPPLGFWLHAATARVCGESDFAARVPELVCFALVCVLIGAMTRRWAGRVAGLAAGVMMALTWEWFARVGNFRLDFHHTLCVLASAACVLRAVETSSESRRSNGLVWTLGAGVSLGLALMTKQIFGLGVLVILLARIGMRASWRGWRRGVRDGASVIVCGGVGVLAAAPWHVDMFVRHGLEYLDQYVLRQSIERASGERFDPEPWWWYLSYVIRREDGTPAWAMWPLLAMAIAGGAIVVARVCAARASERRSEEVSQGARVFNGFGMFALLWTLGWMVMLSMFGDKRHYYMLVVHPGMAALAGIGIAGVMTQLGWDRWLLHSRLVAAAASVLVVACAMVLIGGGLMTRAPFQARVELSRIGEWLREHREPRVWNGGLRYNDGALMYVVTGFWPEVQSSQKSVDREQVGVGELLVYDVSAVRANQKTRTSPDERDQEVFRSGRYVVMRRR